MTDPVFQKTSDSVKLRSSSRLLHWKKKKQPSSRCCSSFTAVTHWLVLVYCNWKETRLSLTWVVHLWLINSSVRLLFLVDTEEFRGIQSRFNTEYWSFVSAFDETETFDGWSLQLSRGEIFPFLQCFDNPAAITPLFCLFCLFCFAIFKAIFVCLH